MNLRPGISAVGLPSSLDPLSLVFGLNLSSPSNGKLKNSCLFSQCTSLARNSSAFSGSGGGSVIFVIRYAVLASAIPYTNTPSKGILTRTKKAMAKP